MMWGFDQTPVVGTTEHRAGKGQTTTGPERAGDEQRGETISWTAPPRLDVPLCLLHGAADQHTLTGLVEEYYSLVEAPAKNLVLLPGGGHCAVLMQPGAFPAELRACINGTPAGTSGPGTR